MLSKDEDFMNAVIDRYRALRQGVLSDAYLNDYMDAVVEWLGPAIDRNFSVWGYALDKDMISPAGRNPHTHTEAVAQMKRCLLYTSIPFAAAPRFWMLSAERFITLEMSISTQEKRMTLNTHCSSSQRMAWRMQAAVMTARRSRRLHDTAIRSALRSPKRQEDCLLY